MGRRGTAGVVKREAVGGYEGVSSKLNMLKTDLSILIVTFITKPGPQKGEKRPTIDQQANRGPRMSCLTYHSSKLLKGGKDHKSHAQGERGDKRH